MYNEDDHEAGVKIKIKLVQKGQFQTRKWI